MVLRVHVARLPRLLPLSEELFALLINDSAGRFDDLFLIKDIGILLSPGVRVVSPPLLRSVSMVIRLTSDLFNRRLDRGVASPTTVVEHDGVRPDPEHLRGTHHVIVVVRGRLSITQLRARHLVRAQVLFLLAVSLDDPGGSRQ